MYNNEGKSSVRAQLVDIKAQSSEEASSENSESHGTNLSTNLTDGHDQR